MSQKKRYNRESTITVKSLRIIIIMFVIVFTITSVMIKNNLIEIFTSAISVEPDNPNLELTKVSSYDNTVTLEGASFIIYEIDELGGEIVDYAKDTYGNYVGEQDVNGDYIVTTDENGEYIAELEIGIYRAVEVEAPAGYDLAEDEEFEINCLQISDIEELVRFAENGKTYSNAIAILTTNLDFNDPTSYKDSSNMGTLTYIPKAEFEGNFYGQGYVISNLTIDETTETPVENHQRGRYNSLCKWSNYRWNRA